MQRMWNVINRSFAVVAFGSLLAACASDLTVAPELTSAKLGSCTNLQTPGGTTLASHAYATGVQIYRWDGAAWVFISPSAVLTTDAAGANTVGIHYSGPTWEGVSGSKTVGTVKDKCTVDANAIPWLLLTAASAPEAGVFTGTTYIQRLNTVGGVAPSAAGTAVGEVRSVAYKAEYFFYR